MAEIAGLDVAEARGCMDEDAVVSGPSLGVLRAMMRGVTSVDALAVLVRGVARPEVADGGRARSSRLGSYRAEALG